MTYSIQIYRHNEGLVHQVNGLPTRYELAQHIDALLLRYPRPLHEFSITGEVCTRYTLTDSDIDDGNQASDRLWAFMKPEDKVW